MKKILLAVTCAAAFAGAPSFAFAQGAAPSEQERAAVKELMDAMDVRKMMTASFTEMEKALPQMMRAQVTAVINADPSASDEKKKAALEKVEQVLPGAADAVNRMFRDPALIDAARAAHPTATWVVSDLAELDLPARGIEAGFDAILCAGNVVGFLAPSTRVTVLERFRSHLADDGRAIIGFGAGRGYEFDDFFEDLASAGLTVELALSTWDLRPFHPGDNFLVAICVRA